MATTQTPAVGDGRGSASPTAGHQPIAQFVFAAPPTQDEVRARLAALDTARHATHTTADPFCRLCPTVRRAPLTHLTTVCGECGELFEPADGETDTVCDSCDGRCPDCGREVSRPGSCFDCRVEDSYVGGLAPRFGAQP